MPTGASHAASPVVAGRLIAFDRPVGPDGTVLVGRAPGYSLEGAVWGPARRYTTVTGTNSCTAQGGRMRLGPINHGISIQHGATVNAISCDWYVADGSNLRIMMRQSGAWPTAQGWSGVHCNCSVLGQSVNIQDRAGNTETTLATGAVPLVIGTVRQVRMTQVGDLLSVYIDGTLIVSATTTAPARWTECGLLCRAGAANYIEVANVRIEGATIRPRAARPVTTLSAYGRILAGVAPLAVPTVPAIGPALWAGDRYWVAVQTATTEARWYGGTDLTALLDRGQLCPAAANQGKCFSVRSGVLAGTTYLWAAYAPAAGTLIVRRWAITGDTLGTPAELSITVSALAPQAVGLDLDIQAGEVANLYAHVRGDLGGAITLDARRVLPDLSASTAAPVTSWTPYAEDFSEVAIVAPGSSGIIQVQMSDGANSTGAAPAGRALEWRAASWGAAWDAPITLDGAITGASGAGDIRDANHATAPASHTGRGDYARLADGSLYLAYIRADDQVLGWGGRVALLRRGPALADPWTLLDLSAMGGDGRYHQLALVSLGAALGIVALADSGGGRADCLHWRVYTPATTGWSARLVAVPHAVSGGATIDRMGACRDGTGRVVAVWTEVTEPGAYDLCGAAWPADG